MGWGSCGENSITGKQMGYAHEGVCSEPGCTTQINHGLAYVCGEMHEGGEHGCGDYFCSEHLYYHHCDVSACQLCPKCYLEYKK